MGNLFSRFFPSSSKTCHAFLSCLTFGTVSLLVSCAPLLAQATPPGGVNLHVVAFGDSLEDVGTYEVFAQKFGGGRFTTNPGTIWTQQIAAYYGDTLTPAFHGGFGMQLTPAGGLGFAQGGARVKETPGVGVAPAGTPNAPFALETAVPVTQQVSNYISMYGKFNSNQLVLMNGGANDLLINLQAVQTDPLKLPGAILAIEQAATDLGKLVAQVSHAGATNIVLLNLADFSKSPEIVTSQPALAPVVSEIIKAFNATLKTTLRLEGVENKIVLIDEFSFLDNILANLPANGFTQGGTSTACNPTAEIAEAMQFGLSNPSNFSDALFCTDATTLVGPNADQTFVFADSFHPTTHYSDLLAQYVEQQLVSRGIGH
jgi:phospholipase/lecithinase/hemolysin